MNVSAQPACSTILADRASKLHGITSQNPCANNAHKPEEVPADGVTIQGPPNTTLGTAIKRKELWLASSVPKATTKSKMEDAQSHTLERDAFKAHTEREGEENT